ncbi:MAG: tetratricopeptide repeat protein [Methylococcaceae bacterium]
MSQKTINTNNDAILEKTIANPNNTISALIDLGIGYHQTGQLSLAKDVYEQILFKEPENFIIIQFLGLFLCQQGDSNTGIALIEKALILNPNYVEAYNNLAEVYKWQHNDAQAIIYYQKALQINPHYQVVLYNLAFLLQKHSKLDEAIGYYRQVVALNPKHLNAYYNLATLLQHQQKLDEAINCYQQLLESNPNHAQSYNNLAVILQQQNKLTQAISYYKQAIVLKPDYADAYYNYSVALQQQNKLEQAVYYCQKAMTLNPDNKNAQWNMAFLQLLQADYARGWQNYESRYEVIEEHIKYRQLLPLETQWQGEPLKGRILLIICEQGLGDAIQFIRYLHLLKNENIILKCSPLLTRLFSSIIDPKAIIDSPTQNLPHFDVHIGLMSLPRLFNTRLESIPASVPYLRVNAINFKNLAIDKNKFNIGFAWSGNKKHKNNHNRSIALELLMPLFELKQCHFYSLQLLPESLQLANNTNIDDCQLLIKDFADSAVIVEQLDLIISIDSAVAHLAGSLAKPVWILLPFAPDWRWLLNRDDSPWYPSARLFRQSTSGDWSEVIDKLKIALQESINQHQRLIANNTHQINIDLAFKHYQQKRFAQAQTLYEQILDNEPNNAVALHYLGLSIYQLGDKQTGLYYLKKAVAVKPDYTHAYYNLGTALQQLQQVDEAIGCYQKAIALNPNHIDAYNNLGVALQSQGQVDSAIAYYQQALLLSPNHFAILNSLATALQLQEKFNEAIVCYQKILALNPKHELSYYHLGNIFLKQRELDRAIACYQEVVLLNPKHLSVYNQLGSAFQKKNNLEQAITYYQKAIELNPKEAIAYYNLATVLQKQANLTKAEQYYQQAIDLNPEYVKAYYNLGTVLEQQNKVDEAIFYYQKAIAINANYKNSYWNMALMQLLKGDYSQGWLNYECRYQIIDEHIKRRHIFPKETQWQGQSLVDKVLLVSCEQGFGDAIQFIRYLALLKAKKLYLRCPKELRSLFSSIIALEFMLDYKQALPEFDVHIALMSLPRLFNTQLNSIPNHVPYLSVNKDWFSDLPLHKNKLNIGFVWSGRKTHSNNLLRSIELQHFKLLFDLTACHFYSLQIGKETEQLAEFKNYSNITDCSIMINDFADTAVIIQHLDLVISIDSAVAHLAGSLSKPVWILLPFAPDWRWLLNRNDSPWYPTARLFRQSNAKDWLTVFNEVKTAIMLLLQNNQYF